jgi:hypothetical protein
MMASGEFEQDGRTVHYEVTEWWDAAGKHHDSTPDESQLLNEARQLTVKLSDEGGNELYFTDFSPDGWEIEELEVDCSDAFDHYTG